MARLGELLVAAGLLTTEQVDRALRAQVMWGARLGTNLIELGFIDLDTLSTVLAQQHKVPAALARHFEKVDRDLQRSLHPDIAEMYTCLPLVRVQGRDIVLASSSPLTKKAQARIADELAVEPEQIILAIAAELRMRYQLERIYNIQRPARFMRSPGKTIPPFPAFDANAEADGDVDGDDLLEAEAAPAVDEIKSTQPFLATYTAPSTIPPATRPASLHTTKPVPTVDEELSVDIDMDDSSPRVPAAPAKPAAIGALPFTTPSLPIPGVAPVVIKPRTAEAKTGVATPLPVPKPAPSPTPPAPAPSISSGRIEIVVPPSEDELATIPVAKLDERDVTIASEATPLARPEPAKPGVVKPVPKAKPAASKFPSLAKFDALTEADPDDSARIETAIPTHVPQDAQTLPVQTPLLKARPETEPGTAAPAKPAKLPSILKPVPAPVPADIAISKSITLDTVVADEDGAIPAARPPRAGSESGAIALPNPRAADMADLDALSAEVDDALSIPQAVEDDQSSGRERRRYVRTIADAPTESERALGRIAIRRMAIAKAAADADEEGNTLGEATRAIRRATNRDRVADLCVDTLFRFAPSCAAAALLVVRGQVATTWKGFIRDGSPPPELAVPLEQPGLIPKAVHRNTTVRAPATDLGPIDQLLMVSLAQKSGDLVIVPISIAKQVMCVIALVTDSESAIATAESVAAGAGGAFARLMRDASR